MAMSRTSRGDERGQLILIAAIIVATAILGGIVLLNTIHASPDVSAQTDAQSVTNTDRISQQVQADLHELFMAANATETEGEVPIPWAEEDGIEGALAGYNATYTQLVSTNKSAIVDVSYVRGEEGSVAYNETETNNQFVDTDPDWIIERADELPRLYLDISDPGSGLEVEINDTATADADIEFVIDDDNDSLVNGDIECDGDEEVTIDLINGSGAIQTDEDYCAVDLDEYEPGDSNYNVSFDVDDPDEIEGMYYVSGADADACADPCEQGIVNPTVEITYQDPNVDYSSEFRLYERWEP